MVDNREYGLVLAGGGTKGAYQVGVWKALKELNIKVPQEVKVFGYDDSEVALISTKTISTVRQPVDEMVEMAVNNLEKLIDEKEILDKKTVLPVEIIKRETTEAK